MQQQDPFAVATTHATAATHSNTNLSLKVNHNSNQSATHVKRPVFSSKTSMLASPNVSTAKKGSILKRSSSREHNITTHRGKPTSKGGRISFGQAGQKLVNVMKTTGSLNSSRANTPGQSNVPVFNNQQHGVQIGAHRGVKHVIANLDASVIDHKTSSCDSSMLNMTASSILNKSGLREPTSF